jgi:hypothetical protein
MNADKPKLELSFVTDELTVNPVTNQSTIDKSNSNQITVIEGKSVTLHCSFDSNPLFSDLVWFRDQKTIVKGAIGSGN